MKKFLLTLTFATLAAAAFSAGPFSLSIGSGNGSLSINNVFSTGHISGDTALFNPGGGITPGTTLWQNYFLVHNVTDNVSFWGDGLTHPGQQIPDGTVTNSSTGFSNIGADLTNNITVDLVAQLTQPTPDDTNRLSFQWTVRNSAATAKAVRIVWNYDIDAYVSDNNYENDVVARANNTLASGKAIAMGNSSGGNVDLNQGVKIESSIPISGYFGISDIANLSGNYWLNDGSYAGKGPGVENAIHSSIINTIQNDADNNGVANSGQDVGGVLQVDLNVPANGSAPVTFYVIWGLNEIAGPNAGIDDWQLF